MIYEILAGTIGGIIGIEGLIFICKCYIEAKKDMQIRISSNRVEYLIENLKGLHISEFAPKLGWIHNKEKDNYTHPDLEGFRLSNHGPYMKIYLIQSDGYVVTPGIFDISFRDPSLLISFMLLKGVKLEKYKI